MESVINFIFLAAIVVAFVYMLREKKRVPEGQIIQNLLVGNQRTLIWILCLLAPVLNGAIFYYGWKKMLPGKAKQANQISLWAFLIEIVIGPVLFFGFIMYFGFISRSM